MLLPTGDMTVCDVTLATDLSYILLNHREVNVTNQFLLSLNRREYLWVEKSALGYLRYGESTEILALLK